MLARLIETHQRTSPWLQHDVISLTTHGEIGARLTQAGISVRALGMVSGFFAPVALLRLFLLLRRDRPDIVQTWMYHADLLGGVAARLAGIQTVLWGVRTSDITKGGAGFTRGIRWLCARLSWIVPKRIICVAEAARQLHIGVGYREDIMMVIPNGLDVEQMIATPSTAVSLRAEKLIPFDALVVGMVGRFNAVKGQQNFVKAAGLIALRNTNVRFLMVGHGCDEFNSVLAGWIAKTGCPECFVLTGARKDVSTCLEVMDIFALPSRTEGFPNVLAEAMAMRLPCVTTDVGDAALVLGDCGEVVPPDNPEALARAVEHIMSLSHYQRSVLGLAARQRIEQEFSMIRCAQQFAAVYNGLQGESRS